MVNGDSNEALLAMDIARPTMGGRQCTHNRREQPQRQNKGKLKSKQHDIISN